MQQHLRRLGRHFRTIATVGTVGGVAFALWGQRDALVAFDWLTAPGAVALAVALFAVAPIVQGIAFWLLLRLLGCAAPLDASLVVWMRGFLVRYAPSGALTVVLRVRERERLHATRTEVLAATTYEQLVALTSGAVVAAGAFAMASTRPPVLALALAGGSVLACVAARPALLGRVVRKVLARRGVTDVPLLRGRHLAAIVAVNASGWLATGAAAHVLLDAFSPVAVPGYWWLLGVYALSVVVGFAMPLLPGGLGAREATMVGFLRGPYGVGPATALVIALRLAATAGELLAIGLVELASLARTRLPLAAVVVARLADVRAEGRALLAPR